MVHASKPKRKVYFDIELYNNSHINVQVLFDIGFGIQDIKSFRVLFCFSQQHTSNVYSNMEEDNCWKFIWNLFMPFIITCRSRGVDVSGFRVFDESGLRGSTAQAKAFGTVDVSFSHVVGDIKKRQSDGAQL